MNSSASVKELATALAIVQGQLTFAKKDSKNPFFKSNYADLESVWDACRDLLSTNGLAIMQFPGDYVDGNMTLTTVMTHSSGEWVAQNMSLPVSKPDAQGAGSAITYMRRYALAAIVGVVQADDDGNSASNKATNVAESATSQQIASINALIEQAEADEAKLLAYFKKPSITLLSRTEAIQAISMLEKKLGAENVSK
jgi:ERF superfamily